MAKCPLSVVRRGLRRSAQWRQLPLGPCDWFDVHRLQRPMVHSSMGLQISRRPGHKKFGLGGIHVQRNGRPYGPSARILRAIYRHVAGYDSPRVLGEPAHSSPGQEDRRGQAPGSPLSGHLTAPGEKEFGNVRWLPCAKNSAGGLTGVASHKVILLCVLQSGTFHPCAPSPLREASFQGCGSMGHIFTYYCKDLTKRRANRASSHPD